MRQANCVLTRLKSGNVYRQLEASEIEGILHHMEFYLNPENYPVWFFEGSEKVNVLPLFEIKVDEVEAPENCLDLKIARAHSPDAQSLYLGGGIGEANLNRLTNCFEVDSINSLPHPLV
jgi:hypothetical protein